MNKILFIDIDGTLLNSEHSISEQTSLAIQSVNSENKIPVILISARPPQAIIPFYNQLGLSDPTVCFNGALIVERLATGAFAILHDSEIPQQIFTDIYSILTKSTLSVSYYRQWEWITENQSGWIKQEEDITGIKTTVVSELANQQTGFNKILIMADPPAIDAVEITLKAAVGNELNIHKSKSTYLEITNATASKKNALIFLLRKFGMKREDVIAIGDHYNDVEMLQYAGTSIAMGNAPDEVKAHATFITLDNDSEGIKYALEKFVH